MSTLTQEGKSSVLPARPARASAAGYLVPVAAFAAVTLMVILYVVTLTPVAVTVNGHGDTVYTHRRTVDRLLLDLGIEARAGTSILPAPETPISRNMQLTVEVPPPFRVLADGRDLAVASWGETAEQVLLDAGLAVDPADGVVVDGVAYGVRDPLPPAPAAPVARTYNHGFAWRDAEMPTRQVRLYRSLPLTVVDGGLPFTVRTTAETVGAALREAKITLYLGDRVQPGLGSAVASGMRITIDRSTPVSLSVDGRTIKTRTRGETVADALAELKVGFSGLDRVTPAPDAPLYEGIDIAVSRVAEEVEVQEEIAPFETLFEPDPNLPIDTQQTVAAGAPGITRTRYRIRSEDGDEVARTLEDTWVAQNPSERIVTYGTRIEPQTMTTPDGQQLTYWRKIRMSVSSYSAGTSGTSPDSPWYGRTYTGAPMRFGVVAVDPKIIPLESQVYVPGYGIGDALDTGGAIRSRRIDLGYNDDNLELWSGWVDVYLLWPPPPEYQITWVVPNWPRPPQ